MSKDTVNKSITSEMENSFLDYAMSVIVSRALPDVRDGLKPVHRRILYAMNEINNTADKPYKKSARIVGDVIGKYHPHGDSSVYEAMVRMAQSFSYRLELVDGHGNFGSIDGDGAAAMRYTEARMSKSAMEMIRDINKDTIDYNENYDGSEFEPSVLPAKFPNLLVNGASGIAVGMATNIPPHNLGEIIDATIALIKNEHITLDELMEYVQGPDFPLGAQILGVEGIKKAYTTGNGSIKVRSKYQIVDMSSGKSMIVINEIPFQVNKALMIEKIADNIRNKVIDGITDLRDESDRDGIRIVIELRKDVTPEVVINNLFKHSQLESTFSINLLSLVDGHPRVLNLKQILYYYLEHQKEVITRRTQFDLNKAEKRAHILYGLKIAVNNIEQVIKTIRESKNTDEAKMSLINLYDLSEEQSKAILEMRLQKLTGLERNKIESELEELEILIKELTGILASADKINEIITEELEEIKIKFSTPRRTEILYDYIESTEDYASLIEEKEVLITLTKEGYIKRNITADLRNQNRGGKGSRGIKLNENDEVKDILFTSTHSDLLFFTNHGKVFKTKGYLIPEYASKTAKGIPLINLIDIDKEDQITTIISLKEYESNKGLLFVTKKGLAKKTKLSEYTRINKNGKIAINVKEEDEVVGVKIVDDKDQIFFATKNGISLKTDILQFRNLGRTAKGVRAIKFKKENDFVIGFGIIKDEGDLIISVTKHGFGKATLATEYRNQSRGGKGTRNLKVTEKTGEVKAIVIANINEKDEKDLVIITRTGQSIRTDVNTIRSTGRNTQGVKIINTANNDSVSDIAIVEKETENKEIEENDKE